MPVGVAGFHGKEPLLPPSAKANKRCPSSIPAPGADIVPVYVSRTPSAPSHFSQQALVPRGFADGN